LSNSENGKWQVYFR